MDNFLLPFVKHLKFLRIFQYHRYGFYQVRKKQFQLRLLLIFPKLKFLCLQAFPNENSRKSSFSICFRLYCCLDIHIRTPRQDPILHIYSNTVPHFLKYFPDPFQPVQSLIKQVFHFRLPPFPQSSGM